MQRSLGLAVQLARLVDDAADTVRHRVVPECGQRRRRVRRPSVLDASGVMGQVIWSRRTSTVMLVTDARHAIPVTLERTGLRTIAHGTGALDRLELPVIPVSADGARRQVGGRLGGTPGLPVGAA